jgi:hypothetical protein
MSEARPLPAPAPRTAVRVAGVAAALGGIERRTGRDGRILGEGRGR